MSVQRSQFRGVGSAYETVGANGHLSNKAFRTTVQLAAYVWPHDLYGSIGSWTGGVGGVPTMMAPPAYYKDKEWKSQKLSVNVIPTVPGMGYSGAGWD